jgi:hypothetical protein
VDAVTIQPFGKTFVTETLQDSPKGRSILILKTQTISDGDGRGYVTQTLAPPSLEPEILLLVDAGTMCAHCVEDSCRPFSVTSFSSLGSLFID